MKILVPTAGPEAATANADYIVSIAKRLDAQLVVIHILDMMEFDEGREALEIFDRAATAAGITCDTFIREGEVVPSIVEIAEEMDVSLIIMGASRGRIVANWIVTDILAETNIPIVIIPYGVELSVPSPADAGEDLPELRAVEPETEAAQAESESESETDPDRATE